MKITKIPRTRDRHKKRVAAYCRVSTKLEEQEESYELQRQYYEKYIRSNTDWEFAGIYSDEKSGTKVKNRPGFRKLIKDALAGDVDYILVKSISRFSRNIVDCQKYVNLLHGNGVDIHFDKENIDTADPSCSMILSFLSAIAQDESRSISENVRWGYRERFKRGEYNIGNNHIRGYYSVDGKLVPNDDAKAIKLIYKLYLDGKTIGEIRTLLAEYGVLTRNGNPIAYSTILYILQNETYKGDKLLQKNAPVNYLTKKPDESIPYESYYLENDHEAIIDKEMWAEVQERLKHRKETGLLYGPKGGKPHFLYGKVFCGDCGAPMTRRTVNGKYGIKQKVWTCVKRHNGNGCKCRNVKEEDLIQRLRELLNTELNEDSVASIRIVTVDNNDIQVEMK